MKLKFCSCHMCRYGRKRYGNPKIINALKRSARHKAEAMIKAGRWEDAPVSIGVPYTD